MKMKLTVCPPDAHVFSEQVEKKFEMLLEECNTEKLTLIGMPLEQLPLNCDGLPLILQNIYDYIIDYGLYDECLFDDAYSKNGCSENILNAYEFVSGSGQSCRTILDVDPVDVATVLVMWLYYLPKPLVSLKQFSLICDMETNKEYQEIIKPMDIVNQLTLQRVIQILDSYEKQHNGYKEKLGSLFTLLLIKHADIASQNNAFQFLDNLKTILMESKIKHDIKTYLDKNENVFSDYNLYDKKNLFRSLSDDGLQLQAEPTKVHTAVKCHPLKRSMSCNLVNFSILSKENDYYKSTNGLSINEDNNLKTKPRDQFSNDLFQDSSICEIDELMYDAQIEDMRSIERTMPTHLKSSVKRNKKKSIRSHVDTVLQTGFLSIEDSLLLQNTLELMKILLKIKNVQNQIYIQRRNLEREFTENEDINKPFSELHFLNHRLEKLVNQKNNYLTRTGLPYGKSYNRTVLNLKNAQKEAFKLQEEEKNNKNSQNENIDKLISDVYNIQIVLDYLQNNCGGKELPWRSSKGLGHKRKTKNQLNCVTVVSDLQTIGEHEEMENIPQPLFKPVEHSDLR